jgi:hypothetical protein
MSEKPILFSAPMVRAILGGTKTQTRRVIKNQPFEVKLVPSGNHLFDYRSDLNDYSRVVDMKKAVTLCPYGQPGGRLWVRETWAPDPPIDGTWASTSWSGCGRVVREIPERFHHPRFCIYAASWPHDAIRWTPSIHMPRWASRITLAITDVRVERLQSLSEADAIAEGLTGLSDGADRSWTVDADSASEHEDPRETYAWLWESINGQGSWDANPFVWVIEFQLVAPVPAKQ